MQCAPTILGSLEVSSVYYVIASLAERMLTAELTLKLFGTYAHDCSKNRGWVTVVGKTSGSVWFELSCLLCILRS